MNILFVCSGNTCRSPMAELYCRSRVAATRCNIDVASAGLCTCTGAAISDPAGAVMREFGIDPDDFRSSPLSIEKLMAADLIIVMTKLHREAIIRFYPEAAAKIHLLLEFSGGGDLSDPFGSDISTYRATFAKMKTAIDNLLEKLQNENL